MKTFWLTISLLILFSCTCYAQMKELKKTELDSISVSMGLTPVVSFPGAGDKSVKNLKDGSGPETNGQEVLNISDNAPVPRTEDYYSQDIDCAGNSLGTYEISNRYSHTISHGTVTVTNDRNMSLDMMLKR